MFVELTEGTAAVSHILLIIRWQWGEHVTLVSNDRLEFEDSPGSTGKFRCIVTLHLLRLQSLIGKYN